MSEVLELCARQPSLKRTKKQRGAHLEFAASRSACDFPSHRPAVRCLAHNLLCAQLHEAQRLVLVICVDINGYVFDEDCFLAICGRPVAPSQKFCQLVVRSRHSSRVCAAKEKERTYARHQKKVVSYKQLEFVRFDFPGCRNIISDVRGPDRGKSTFLFATESRKARAAR